MTARALDRFQAPGLLGIPTSGTLNCSTRRSPARRTAESRRESGGPRGVSESPPERWQPAVRRHDHFRCRLRPTSERLFARTCFPRALLQHHRVCSELACDEYRSESGVVTARQCRRGRRDYDCSRNARLFSNCAQHATARRCDCPRPARSVRGAPDRVPPDPSGHGVDLRGRASRLSFSAERP